jgi:hypothetical protein
MKRRRMPRLVSASGTTITVAWEDGPPTSVGDYTFQVSSLTGYPDCVITPACGRCWYCLRRKAK